MPIFDICNGKLTPIEQTEFKTEKILQNLIEKNLKPVFNCQFVASEYSTGSQHAGRIDTLAISEDNNPVIIEYKKVESSELINQSLFYLSWIHDHRGDFAIAVQKSLGNAIEIDNRPKISRDVTDIGHFATGNFEITIKTESDFETAKKFIEMAY